jgi:hypothetical protein
MAKREFKFIDRYRTLMPAASSEVVTARQKAHDKLYPEMAKNMDRVYDMCALAFQQKRENPAIADWFEKLIRTVDPQFTVSVDKAEAGRIACLLLQDLITRGSPQGAMAVLVASFAGKRPASDDGELVNAARDALEDAAKTRRIGLGNRKIVAEVPGDAKAELDAMVAGWNANTTRTAIAAAIAANAGSDTSLAASATEAFEAARQDAQRLAEEVDMLWWFIGGWSETLGRTRSGLSSLASALVSGCEIGGFVKNIPGSYGAYGLLRKAVEPDATKIATLRSALKALGADVSKLAKPLPEAAWSIFPVTGALKHASSVGLDNWTVFDAQSANASEVEVTTFELSVQTFRESALISWGGLPK